MDILQFEIPGKGRRLGYVEGNTVVDVTAAHPELTHLFIAAEAALRAKVRLDTFLKSLAGGQSAARLEYQALLQASPGGGDPFLRPPLDHPDPHRVLVTGTGLTHTGSMQSRDAMHRDVKVEKSASAAPATSVPAAPSDSAKMFEMGVRGGRPATGTRGTSPEWFYKGDGGILRGHREGLEIPAYAVDGGEEPEIVGCYLIDSDRQPRRIGFALGNEWSDHATEKINYLYLAPSKLRSCSVGPTLNTHHTFNEVSLRCRIRRNGKLLYDSGPLSSGEKSMCHSLANLEDHHFKYAQHRRPGDIHFHFFGTSKLSHDNRDWKFEPGDEIEIAAPNFCEPLVNPVVAGPEFDGRPVKVVPL